MEGLGLVALGDRITLRSFCQSTPSSSHDNDSRFTSKRVERAKRSEMMKALLQGTSDHQVKKQKQSDRSVRGREKTGRPKLSSRRISAGLRLAASKKDSVLFKQIKSPLGDNTCVPMKLDNCCSYNEALSIVTGTFFPNGTNKILGSEEDYDLELVNVGNRNINLDIQEVLSVRDEAFTLERYIEIKKYQVCFEYIFCVSLNQLHPLTLTYLWMVKMMNSWRPRQNAHLKNLPRA